METNNKVSIFAREARDFERKLQDFIRHFFDSIDTPKPLIFNNPFLSFVYGESVQINGVEIAKNGRIKPIVEGWCILETPSIALLDIPTLVRIADKLNNCEYHFKEH